MPPKKRVKKLTYDEKKEIIDKITNMKSKKILANIFAITYNEKKKFSQNTNGIFINYNDVSDETFNKIDAYITEHTKVKVVSVAEDNNKYQPYTEDEFPENNVFSPKLKFSNREKNFIKRKRYEENMDRENNEHVVYEQFNVKNIAETEKVIELGQ